MGRLRGGEARTTAVTGAPPTAAPRDRGLLYAAAFFRAAATGLVGVGLGLYLGELALEPRAIGAVVSLGLAGGAAATAAVTVLGTRIRHRSALRALAVLAAFGAAALVVVRSPAAIAAVAFVGMVNGMGRDRGAALVIEQAMLPATVTDERRTFAFAVYALLQDAGHAIGGLLAGWVPLASAAGGAAGPSSARGAIVVYAILSLAPCALYAALSPAADVATPREHRRLSPASRRVLTRISTLFALDGLGGGFLTATLLTVFFRVRFGAGAPAIGALFFGARVANAVSHLAAAWLARRIGLVNTMVATHVPSSLLLATMAIAPSFAVAAVLFLLREGLVEMDVPTRQSYVMAVVRPEERVVASGVTHLVRLAAWAAAPVVAGASMQRLSLAAPLLIGAAMKIAYDVMLYVSFRRVRPPEEAA